MSSESFTDLGNARRLVKRHGRDLRYVPEWGSWLAWDEKRWALDVSGEAMRRAKKTVASMYAEAAELEDDDERKPLAKHASKSESARALKAMVELATTEPGIPVSPSELDANPNLLNCVNGTLNLRTEVLQPHRREDLCTKITGVPYDQDAECPVFSNFLNKVLPKPDVRQFVQRAVGYSCLATGSEEVLFFVHGPTAAGKSTLLEGAKGALGTYAATASFETFLQQSNAGGPRPDIARLAGSRFVASIEVEDGRKLAAGMVKTLVGRDTQVCRFLYGREFEFKPQFVLWLAANDEPRVPDNDEALWRRILQIPFTVTIPEQDRDPSIKETICDPKGSAPAVLAWIVEGCRNYLNAGLAPPEDVVKATAAYRERMDSIKEWFEECVQVGPTLSATISEFYASYAEWCKRSGIRRPMSAISLGKRLSARGWKPLDDRSRTREGIGVRTIGG